MEGSQQRIQTKLPLRNKNQSFRTCFHKATSQEKDILAIHKKSYLMSPDHHLFFKLNQSQRVKDFLRDQQEYFQASNLKISSRFHEDV